MDMKRTAPPGNIHSLWCIVVSPQTMVDGPFSKERLYFVMLSQASVNHSVHGERGMRGKGGMHGKGGGGMRGEVGHAWQRGWGGVCMVKGGMHGEGGCAWQ